MNKLILFLVGFALMASAAEYGYFHRADTSSNWIPETITLAQGDRFVLLRADNEYYDNTYRLDDFNFYTTRNPFTQFSLSHGDFTRNLRLYSAHFFQHGQGNSWGMFSNAQLEYTIEDVRTIPGPCVVSPNIIAENGTWVPFKIIRVKEEESGSKFTASLNSEGTRLAIGLMEQGSNGVARVFEYDGSNWIQLGEDVQ